MSSLPCFEKAISAFTVVAICKRQHGMQISRCVQFTPQYTVCTKSAYPINAQWHVMVFFAHSILNTIEIEDYIFVVVVIR